MSFNGSGTFLRVMDWEADRDAGIKIRADRHDQEDDNFAAGLTNTITKDGQTQPVANIPMNGFKIINLGTPTTNTDAVTKAYVDSFKKFTNDIEVTDAVIFKDGTTTRGYIESAIGAGVAAKMTFETDNDAGVYVNRMALDVSGLLLREGAFRIAPGDVIRGSFAASSSASPSVSLYAHDTGAAAKAQITAGNTEFYYKTLDPAVTVIPFQFRQPDNAIRGLISTNIGAATARVTIEANDAAGALQNRLFLDVNGINLKNGHLRLQGTLDNVIRVQIIGTSSVTYGFSRTEAYNNAGALEAAVDFQSAALTSRGDGSAREISLTNLVGSIYQARMVWTSAAGNLQIQNYNASGALLRTMTFYGSGALDWDGTSITINANRIAANPMIVFQGSAAKSARMYYLNDDQEVHIQTTTDNYANGRTLIRFQSDGTATIYNQMVFANYLSGCMFASAGFPGKLYGNSTDGADLAGANMEMTSWWGIAFRCATDNVVRLCFDTRNGRATAAEYYLTGAVYFYNTGSGLYNDGNIVFTSGMAAFGGNLHAALTTAFSSNAVYAATDVNNLTFPLGTNVFAYGPPLQRNARSYVALRTGDVYRYDAVTTTPNRLAGEWAARGLEDQSGSRQQIFERVA